MVALEDGTTYRVVANQFLADGGDNFATIAEGQDQLVGGLDIDAFRTYLIAHHPIAVPATDRITVQP